MELGEIGAPGIRAAVGLRYALGGLGIEEHPPESDVLLAKTLLLEVEIHHSADAVRSRIIRRREPPIPATVPDEHVVDVRAVHVLDQRDVPLHLNSLDREALLGRWTEVGIESQCRAGDRGDPSRDRHELAGHLAHRGGTGDDEARHRYGDQEDDHHEDPWASPAVLKPMPRLRPRGSVTLVPR